MQDEMWEGFKAIHHPSTVAHIESIWGQLVTLDQFSEEHLKKCQSKHGKPSHVRHMFKHLVSQGWIKDASAQQA